MEKNESIVRTMDSAHHGFKQKINHNLKGQFTQKITIYTHIVLNLYDFIL